jgi:transposase
MQILFCKERIKKLRALAACGDVDIWALDEVHFQQHGSRCRMWIPPEIKDPVLMHAPTRFQVGYFGAVRVRDGKFLYARESGTFSGESFWSFLKLLKLRSERSGRRVIIITDNAKYHHARVHKEWRETQSPLFELHYLPPYSPELNPIERVWKLTRRLCLHNVYFESLQPVIESVEWQFNQWLHGSPLLRKLCTV